jgi:hypothetical protein
MKLLYLITLFFNSLILYTILFSLIKAIYLGNNLNHRFHKLITQNKNLMTLLIFILSFIIIYYLNNPINLKDIITITTQIEGIAFQLSDETINVIFYQLSIAGVLTVGARIAASLVEKQSLSLLAKTKIVAIGAKGLIVTYKLLFDSLPKGKNNNITLNTEAMEIQIEGLTLDQVKIGQNIKIFSNENLNNLRLDNLNFKPLNFDNLQNSNLEETSKTIQELNKINPNWKNSFINSPLEPDKINCILDSIKDIITLHFISTYLLVILLIILITKLVLLNLNYLKKFKLNKIFKSLLIKYISVWRKNSSIWIFFILVLLIIFNLASFFSLIYLKSFLT